MARIIPIPIGPIFPGGSCGGIIHVIQKGDTLYQLGKKYHVSVGQLMFANPFVDVYNLQIGDELCIPATIQPRAVGASERQQSGNMDNRRMPRDWEEMPGRNVSDDWNSRDDWDDRPDRDDWDDRDDRSDRDDWDDRDGRSDRDDRQNRPNWMDQGEMPNRRNWMNQGEMPDQENWIDQEEVFGHKSMDEI